MSLNSQKVSIKMTNFTNEWLVDFVYSVVELEQVPTSAHIASRMLFSAENTYEDIEGCAVGDFGCGTGMLSLGCSFLGASYVTGFDVDEDALDIAWVNCKKLEVFDIDLVLSDVTSLGIQSGTVQGKIVSTNKMS